ncbi:MAG: hypothetical protein AAF762_01235 [Pseudomonadota bacterium]
MTRRAAILGLGQRGRIWADVFRAAGWQTRGFDPDENIGRTGAWTREATISGTVHGADWVAVCLPERLELMQKVMQRAQFEAPEEAVFGVVTEEFGIEDIQNCALRPANVMLAEAKADGGFALDVSAKTTPRLRSIAEDLLAELAAHRSLETPTAQPAPPDAESA